MQRTINITTIDDHGSPATTQIATRDFEDARKHLRDRVTEAALRAARNTWNNPIVAAYIYDTETSRLHRYTVINHPIDLPTIQEEEQL